MSVAQRSIEMAEGTDGARSRMLSALKPHLDKSPIQAFGNNVFLAIYNRAGQQTGGGLYLPETSEEDKYQGKVCLIVGFGGMCSNEASPGYDAWFGGSPPKLHDWIGVNTRDGTSFLVGDVACRMVPWDKLLFGAGTPDKAY